MKMVLRALLVISLVIAALTVAQADNKPHIQDTDSRLISLIQHSNTMARVKRTADPQWGYYNSYCCNYGYGGGYHGHGRGFGGSGFRRGVVAATLVGGAAFGGALLGAGLAHGK